MATKVQHFSELSKSLADKTKVSKDFFSLLDTFRLGHALVSLKMEKRSGVKSVDLLKCLLIFRLCGESIYRSYKNHFGDLIEGGKNQFYRFLVRANMNWRQLLLRVVSAFIRIVKERSYNEQIANWQYVILDDTTLPKSGLCMEGITKVFDHVMQTCVLGYKLLLLAISDGATTLPIDFSLHAENRKDGKGGLSEKQLHKRRTIKRRKDDCIKQRRKELDCKKTDIALQMLKNMVSQGISPSYLLMDKWFCLGTFISDVRKIKNGALHIVTLLKDKRHKFLINGKALTTDMYLARYQRMRYSERYKCRYLRFDSVLNDVPIRLFIVKYGNSQGYEVILTTDLSLTFNQAFGHYVHRWSIEVLFKECKQHLALGDCQSTHLNAQIADCTLVFIGYCVIALKKRFDEYESWGDVFRCLQKEMLSLTFVERLLPLIQQLIETLLSFFGSTLDEVMPKLIADSKIQENLVLFLKINQSVKEHL